MTHKRYDRYIRAQHSGTECDSPVDRLGNNRGTRKKDLAVFRLVKDRFREALDYRAYHLADNWSRYDEKLTQSVAKWAKRFQVRVKSKTFNSFDPIFIIRILSAFKLVCDTNCVHTALLLLHFFMKCHAAAALSPCIAFCSKLHRPQKRGTVTTYCEVVNYFLQTCMTNDVIVEADSG